MSSPTDHVMTLLYWNILILPSEQEIFVGLRQRPEVIPPFKPPQDGDELLPFTLPYVIAARLPSFMKNVAWGLHNPADAMSLLANQVIQPE